MDENEEIKQVETVEPEAEAEETPEAKEKSNLQARFDKITREKYEAFQERDAERKAREALEARIAELENAKQPEPTIESFDYDEDAYNKAQIQRQAEEAARRIITERDAQQSQQAEHQKAIERAKQFAGKEAKFAAEIQDYDQVAKNPMLPITDTMAEIIQSSDEGPALAYHLGKHPDQAYHIAHLDPVSAQRELLKIEASFNKPKAVSNAPEPVPDIGGADVPIQDMDNLPVEEWIKRRNRQVHGS